MTSKQTIPKIEEQHCRYRINQKQSEAESIGMGIEQHPREKYKHNYAK